MIEASAPAAGVVNNHQAKLYNVTDSTTTVAGTTELNASANSQSRSHIVGQFTVTASKVFEIRHACNTTVNTIGFGDGAGFGEPEVYTTVKITQQ